MSTVQVTVTQDDITNGMRAAAARCPVALAIKRVVKPGTILAVGPSLVTLLGEYPPAFNADLPNDVRSWVRDYDLERKTMYVPFSFLLDLPRHFLPTVDAAGCPLPGISQGRVVLRVGMQRSDENGWLMIDAIDRDCGVVWGYHCIDKHGAEHYIDAAKMGDDWHD